MHRLFQPSKSPGTVHRQYVQEAFLWLGQDLEYIVTRNFVIGRDAEVALDRKKRAGLYMVVRPIFFIVVRAVYAPAEGYGNKHFVIKFEAGRDE